MRNLYRLNSNFEFILSTYPNMNVPKKSLQRRFFDLEYLFLLLAKPEDFVLMSEEPNPELLEIWKSRKLNFGTPIVKPNHLFQDELSIKNIENFNLIEWGNISEIKNGKLVLSEDKISDARKLNSKFEQSKFKFKNKYIPNLKFIKGNELINIVEESEFPIVFKKEFSFSGNGNSVYFEKAGFYTNGGFNKIRRILKDETLMLEEWKVNKIEEFSYLFQDLKFLSKTKMEISSTGEFLGIELVDSVKPNLNFVKEFLSDKDLNYNSYYSVDGFSYQSGNEIKNNLFSEINFRYSMGIILYLLNQKYNFNFKLKYINKLIYNENKEKLIPLSPYFPDLKIFVLEAEEFLN